MSEDPEEMIVKLLRENYHYRGFANFVNQMVDGTINPEIAIGCIKQRLDFLEADINLTEKVTSTEGE